MADEKKLKDGLDDILGDAKEGAKKASDKASELADDAKETMNEFAGSAKEAFGGVNGENKKLVAGLLGIFLGSFGVHKFFLGYNKEGIIQLIASVVTCGVVGIVGFIEGIIYLTKSDEEFYNTYQIGKKPWF